MSLGVEYAPPEASVLVYSCGLAVVPV